MHGVDRVHHAPVGDGPGVRLHDAPGLVVRRLGDLGGSLRHARVSQHAVGELQRAFDVGHARPHAVHPVRGERGCEIHRRRPRPHIMRLLNTAHRSVFRKLQHTGKLSGLLGEPCVGLLGAVVHSQNFRRLHIGQRIWHHVDPTPTVFIEGLHPLCRRTVQIIGVKARRDLLALVVDHDGPAVRVLHDVPGDDVVDLPAHPPFQVVQKPLVGRHLERFVQARHGLAVLQRL